ncbi:MAG: protein translocase SEC61 complex subunit gamma [Candidatus Heimdallarchaeota archaeon]|nr:MAG: protein translocase SEC61 complex subunit gamma [Candidatus Heimdallarchaeota archaeon]
MSLDSSRIGTASFYKRAIRILKLAKRPDRSEVFLVIKITVAGMAILGLIAYVIRFVLAAVLQQEM